MILTEEKSREKVPGWGKENLVQCPSHLVSSRRSQIMGQKPSSEMHGEDQASLQKAALHPPLQT